MKKGLNFARVIYLSLAFGCIAASIIAVFRTQEGSFTIPILAASIIIGIMLGVDYLLRKQSLKALNTVIVGLFIGYFFGQALIAIASPILSLLNVESPLHPLSLLFLFIFGAYFGLVMTLKASGTITAQIPFVRFTNAEESGGTLILDPSVLADPRIIDLASSGLIDGRLGISETVTAELQALCDTDDEGKKSLGRSSLETLKRLEALLHLKLQKLQPEATESNDPFDTLVQLARSAGGYILSNEINSIQASRLDGIRVISINKIANALKPVSDTGEHLNIKVQRYGKEARQGVGYLDDGTMVVINGGAEYIGETIKSKVLSVKHTSSGRMIFCNATDEELISEDENTQTLESLGSHHKNYLEL